LVTCCLELIRICLLIIIKMTNFLSFIFFQSLFISIYFLNIKALFTRDISAHNIAIKKILQHLTISSYMFLLTNQVQLLQKPCVPFITCDKKILQHLTISSYMFLLINQVQILQKPCVPFITF